jgi:hypothetical protein
MIDEMMRQQKFILQKMWNTQFETSVDIETIN